MPFRGRVHMLMQHLKKLDLDLDEPTDTQIRIIDLLNAVEGINNGQQ
jgi:hypothetical protein